MTPKISIITITYNSAKTVEDTIKSVVSQEYTNLEYIIIDGVSKDNTLEIVRKYEDQITIISSEPDQGISDAFNKGISKATGEIIGIINSDDILLPGALQMIADNYDPEVGVYRGNTIVWNPVTNKKYRAIPTMSFSKYALNVKICHQSTFVTKGTYEKYGLYKVNYRFMMDADLLSRLSVNNVKMKYLNFDMAVSAAGGVTDRYSYRDKLSERYDVIVSNGGLRIMAFIVTMFFVLKQIIKNRMRMFLSSDLLKSLKYGAEIQ